VIDVVVWVGSSVIERGRAMAEQAVHSPTTVRMIDYDHGPLLLLILDG
jgi:hypothetical protein